MPRRASGLSQGRRRLRRHLGSLGLIGIGLALGPREADAQSVNVTAVATVTQSCHLTVTAAGVYNNLVLTSGHSDVVVATANERCNDARGYKVIVSTRNGSSSGVLKGKTYGETLVYGVNYGAPTTLTFAGATATATSTNEPANTTITVGISYSGNPHLTADTYTDTLTFTMTTN
jgi:hypothetical protein